MSGIYAEHMRALIRQTLRYLEPEIPYSEAAVELLMLTASQETQLGRYLVQIRGPARGIFQMEPASEQDLLVRLKLKDGELYKKLMSFNVPVDGQGGATDCDMVFNLAYQIAAARCFYYLKPGPIPQECGGWASYYKKFWNTAAGRATVAEAMAVYCQLCLPVKDA